MSDQEIDQYRCKHGVLGHCDRCWAEDFRERRLNNPDYRQQVEESRKKEKAALATLDGEVDKDVKHIHQDK